MASLHVIEQATLEMFLSVLLDENENCEIEDQKIFEYKGPESIDIADDWKELKEMDPDALFIDNQYIEECDIVLSIKKFRDSFCIYLNKHDS